jgi:hypothetical protein
MLRLALLLSLLPLAAVAQVTDTPFEQPAPLNMEDGSPFPLGPDGQPMRPQPRGGAQVLQGLDGMSSAPRPAPRGELPAEGGEVGVPTDGVIVLEGEDALEAEVTPDGQIVLDGERVVPEGEPLPGTEALGELGPAPQGENVFPGLEIRPSFDDTPREVREEQQVASSPGALLRGLDKVSGAVTDLDLSVGETVQMGRLAVTLEDCRYPVNDPAGDAYALLLIQAEGMSGPAFEGWMIASSPALSALDHPRYDVWVMRCRSS